MAIRIENGRAVLHCERCASRIDLGPELQVRVKRENNALRLPTGWFAITPEEHLCPTHSMAIMNGT